MISLQLLGVAFSAIAVASMPSRNNIIIQDDNPILLPLSFYSPVAYAINTEQDEYEYVYAQWTQCDNTRAGFPYILISILQPDNVNFDPSSVSGYAVMEISICAHSFATDCVVATNYNYDKTSGIIQGYNNVTLLYNSSILTYYFRLKAEVHNQAVAIHIGYLEQGAAFSGKQESFVFQTNNGNPTAKWNYFSQFIKTEEISNVNNGDTVLYYTSFCKADISTSDYTVEITVTGTPNTPLGGFDLAGCSKAALANINTCQVTNNGQPGVVAKQQSSSSTSVKLNDATYSLSDGIYVRIMGVGGELNGLNEYILTIVINNV